MRNWLLLFTIQLLARGALAGEPAPAPVPTTPVAAADTRSAVTHALVAALALPVRIGDPWGDTQQQLYGMRCMPEDSVLFSAMDCRSDLAVGPFSAAGPEGDGLTVYSDDDAMVTRVSASRTTSDAPRNCLAFQSAVSRALTKAGVPSALDRIPEGIRLRAGAAGDLQLTIECKPEAQTLELADAWVHLVPRGNCRGLESAPPEQRALADSAMTGDVHDNFDELGTACNRPGFEVNEFAGQMMDGLMAAYTALKLDTPEAPPSWLVAQIRGGFANARLEAAGFEPNSRHRFETYLARESTLTRLGSLWSKMRRDRQHGLRSGGRVRSSSGSTQRKHH